MFEKTPVQQMITFITTSLLVGTALWITLLVRAALLLREGGTAQQPIEIGAFHVASIVRSVSNGRDVLHIQFSAGLFWFYLVMLCCGLLSFWLVRLFMRKR